ncbi:MAG: 3-deoxy-D-manno-octulosonic acid transferase [Planctomycetota bacterium]
MSEPTTQGPGALHAAGRVPPPLGRDPNPGLRITLLYWIYDIIWSLALLATSPWWLVRCLFDREFCAMVKGRLTLTLPELPPPGERPRVLVHGVSVGEVKASQSIVRALEADYDVVVSASTNTGMQVARQLYPELPVVRFPIDHMLFVSRFLLRVSPALVVLMELEIWPNFLRKANRRGIPVAILSGRITEKSFQNYKKFGSTLPQFNRITVFGAQDERYAERFRNLARSAERVVVTGNVKVDGLRSGPVPHDTRFRELQRLAGSAPGQPVLVAGSTHEPEEVWVHGAFLEGAPGARVILVPRHPERGASVVDALAARGARAQRLTDLRAGRERPDPQRPLVVDTIGELERIYGLADLVFVGGSLVPHGGQNMLEPAAQGCPVLYGPHVDNFAQEAALLEDAGGARRVADAAHLARAVQELLADPAARDRMAQAGVRAVEDQKGATARTLKVLSERCLVVAGTRRGPAPGP